MKRFLLLILSLFAINSLYAQTQWVNPYPQYEGLQDITLVKDETIVAVGNLGAILYSENFGEDWQIIEAIDNNNLLTAHFYENGKGLIGSEEGYIYSSDNGGKCWIKESFEFNEKVKDIFSSDDYLFVLTNSKLFRSLKTNISWQEVLSLNSPNEGWISGDGKGYIASYKKAFRTTDNGASWSVADSSQHIYKSVSFSDENNGYFLCNSGSGTGDNIIKTTDGGVTFSNSGFGVNFLSFNKVFALSSEYVCAIGNMVMYTSDSGNSWDECSVNFQIDESDHLYSAVFLEDGRGLSVGAQWRQMIVYSSDLGKSWILENDFSKSDFSKVISYGNGSWDITGYEGIYTTTDNGVNWTEKPDTYGIKNSVVEFLDSKHGIAGGATLRVTVDGGLTWQKPLTDIFNPDDIALTGVSILDHNNAWVAGWREETLMGQPYTMTYILRSIDGAKTFKKMFYQENYGEITSIDFISNLVGWATISGKVYKTVNSGSSWIEYFQHEKGIHKIRFYDEIFGVALSSNGMYFVTTDGGDTWQDRWSGTMGYHADITFIDHKTFILAGRGVMLFEDYGNTMTMLTNSTDSQYNYFKGVNVVNRKGFAVGDLGRIMNIDLDAVVSVNDDEPEIVNDFTLSQNYPNPFNPETTISFTLPQTENVKLSVYDITGQLITTLVNNKMSAGNYNFIFDGSNLSSGIYLYKIEAGNFTQTNKMVLLK